MRQDVCRKHVGYGSENTKQQLIQECLPAVISFGLKYVATCLSLHGLFCNSSYARTASAFAAL